MAKRINKLRKHPHHPEKTFCLNLSKDQIDYIILALEKTEPKSLVSDEEDDWVKKSNLEVHVQCLNILRKTDIDNGD